MTPKTPTASGISRLLAKAGHVRSEYGRLGSSSGYRVSKDYRSDSAVRVRYPCGGVARRGDMDRAKEKLAEFAETIKAAGWAVETGEYELIVTAKTED